MMLFRCASPGEKLPPLFYPMPPQQPRLQFLVSITSEEDIGKKQRRRSALQTYLTGDFTSTDQSSDSSLQQIGRAYDIGAVKGKIYITDRVKNKILIINLDKKMFDFLPEVGQGVLSEPAGIWVTEEDYKYIADFSKKQVVVFDNNNNFVRAYGESGQFEKPIDVAVFQNRIYICDLNRHQIIILDKDSGKTIQAIGGIGAQEEKFYKPTHVIVDSIGNFYVNDSFNSRIQKFDPNGKLLKIFGYHGDTLGGFARPKGIDIDRDGHLYAADAIFENVQIFDANTADLLLFFGEFGPSRESMYLPLGIHIDYENVEYFNKYSDKNFRIKYLVYVSNSFGENKINVYGFGDWTGKPFQKTENKIEQDTEP
jgi:DNA-binding beta-propeller fold protein YncE